MKVDLRVNNAGRPKKPEAEKVRFPIGAFFTSEEAAAVRAYCNRNEITMASLVRRATLRAVRSGDVI